MRVGRALLGSAVAAIRGAVLLVGPTLRNADAYVATPSGLTRLTTGAKLASVTADGKRIVVATASRISALHGHVLRGLGLGSAFSPALSASDALAWVALDLSN